MGTKSGEVVESAGAYTVLRLFPERRVLVKQLLTRDESFRAMCDDLAAAESALGAVDRLPGHIRSGRRAEYRGARAEPRDRDRDDPAPGKDRPHRVTVRRSLGRRGHALREE